jgi:hypothetical protein
MPRKIGFTLALGGFQIHLTYATIHPAVEWVNDALQLLRDAIGSGDVRRLAPIADEVRASGDAPHAALASIESPEVLPAMTRQLLYASLV